ncbi:hypothetical protein [Paraburkholderia sp. GAS334]|uniref:hypothetical protein n=1 Tax=Paraburkholderia sp. GAS334 TaxID=3035131 RepID=UPI003D230CC1
MTNTGKILIVGLLLVELGFVSYLLSPKGDPSPVEVSAGRDSAAITAGVDSRFGAQVTMGSVASAAPSARSNDGTAKAPQPSPARNVVPESVPAVRSVAQEPKPEVQPHQQPTRTLDSADAQASLGSKAAPVPGKERGHDDLNRRRSNQVSTAMTDELVRESSKPDPALPPPDPSVRDGLHRRGSNQVAAAMTEELVRESSKPDPALPPPPKPPQSNRPSTQ